MEELVNCCIPQMKIYVWCGIVHCGECTADLRTRGTVYAPELDLYLCYYKWLSLTALYKE